jgi:small subunit ribosomal protein S18
MSDSNGANVRDGRLAVPVKLLCLRGLRVTYDGGYMFKSRTTKSKKRMKARARTKKKDPLFVDGHRPRPMYVDYKDIELLKKLVNRHGRIVSRRKTGCSAASQHAVTEAIKRARFMALLPYVGE